MCVVAAYDLDETISNVDEYRGSASCRIFGRLAVSGIELKTDFFEFLDQEVHHLCKFDFRILHVQSSHRQIEHASNAQYGMLCEV